MMVKNIPGFIRNNAGADDSIITVTNGCSLTFDIWATIILNHVKLGRWPSELKCCFVWKYHVWQTNSLIIQF